MDGVNTVNSARRTLALGPVCFRPTHFRRGHTDMGIEAPNDIDRAGIEAHAQRTVEQAALRKVRRALDQIKEAEAAGRRTLPYVLIPCAIFAVIGVLAFAGLMFSGRDLQKGTPMKVPRT